MERPAVACVSFSSMEEKMTVLMILGATLALAALTQRRYA